MARDPPFKLSQTLVGHNEDVKGVVFVDEATIISCSRDATVRIWKTSEEKDSDATAAAGTSTAPPTGSDAMDTTTDAPRQTAPESEPTAMDTEATPAAEPAEPAEPPASAPAIATVKQALFADTINSNAQGFVNCVAYMKPDADHPEGLIISAGQESLIDVRPPGYLGPDAAYLLIGHAGNVCSLDVNEQTIISGSWDK
ncbi:hypothetical protein ABW21_db0207913 [Orbilia brochopaga]|nr:hypothetical protein ABW21_db0207913 [Drechslerella brochopaga]